MLDVNQVAPDFTLPAFGSGESHFYEEAKDTSVLIFYKFSCGTCRFTFPYLQKIYDAYGDAFYFKAIAEDDADATAKFQEELGISIPTLLDKSPYKVSAAYGLDTVPSIFIVPPSRQISFATHSFVKQDILNFADTLAEKSGRPQIDVFGSADVPDMKPG